MPVRSGPRWWKQSRTARWRFVVDLSDVEHLDSAGIQLIYRLRENLRVRGQSLRLVIPQRSAAHDALRLAAVFSYTQLAGTVDDALAELAT